MNKGIFSKLEQEELLRNPNIEKCSNKSITYSSKFKISAVKKYKGGISIIQIFKQAKISIDIIRNKNPKGAGWQRIKNRNFINRKNSIINSFKYKTKYFFCEITL